MFKIGGLYSVHAGGSGNCGEKHCAEVGAGCFPSRRLVKSNENSS